MHFTRSIALLSTIAAAIAVPMPGLSSRDDLTDVEKEAFDGVLRLEGTTVNNPISDGGRQVGVSVGKAAESIGNLGLGSLSIGGG